MLVAALVAVTLFLLYVLRTNAQKDVQRVYNDERYNGIQTQIDALDKKYERRTLELLEMIRTLNAVGKIETEARSVLHERLNLVEDQLDGNMPPMTSSGISSGSAPQSLTSSELSIRRIPMSAADMEELKKDPAEFIKGLITKLAGESTEVQNPATSSQVTPPAAETPPANNGGTEIQIPAQRIDINWL
jgi:hypothetical protein